jgi:tRNA/tmRNA/rRNA uracil-C5-methylase (TrmA/RlmC/RlmD family)
VIEDVLLETLESIDLQRVQGGKARNVRLAEEKEELGRLQDENISVERRIQGLIEVAQARDGTPPIVLLTEIEKLDQQNRTLTAEISKIEMQIDQIVRADPKKHRTLIRNLTKEIRSDDGTPKNELARRALAAEIQRLVQYVQVIPNVRLVHEAVSEDGGWKKAWGVKSERELDKLFRHFGFEFLIVYRNGNRHYVDALKGVYLRRKGSLKEKNLRFLTASPSSKMLANSLRNDR